VKQAAAMLVVLISCSRLNCTPDHSRASCLRDPFAPTDCTHAYRCVALGELCVVGGRTDCCAFICIDGMSYSVRTGDVVAGHLVQSISETAVTMKDEMGREQRIFKQKKRPFNLNKLKG